MAYGNGGTYGAETGSIGGYNAVANTPQRESLVNQHIGRLDKNIEGLHQLITGLESRLTAVLMPDAPTPQSGAAEKAPSLPVPLAHMTAGLADRVQLACARIEQLIGRIEV